MADSGAFPLTDRRIVLGTRGSALARWQADFVLAALRRISPGLDVETRVIHTEGDRDLSRSLSEFVSIGVFTAEIENALLRGEIDLAVHSLKDLPTELAAGLAIAAIPEREDARDCIVSRHGVGLLSLPSGAWVGTSSVRRAAQVRALRPDAIVVPLRGNVDTRLRKAHGEEYDAVVLAAAGLLRLGRAGEISEYLSIDSFLPDPGQGALAIETRADDEALRALVARLDHASTRAAVTAERAFLLGLGGGCRMPIGAFAEVAGSRLSLKGLLASDDGSRISRAETTGSASSAQELGRALAVTVSRQSKSASGGVEISHSSGPLAGRKIVVTRPRDQAEEFADKIRAAGGEPIVLPAIDVAPLDDFAELDRALARAGEFDWVVFTSANGVLAVKDRMPQIGLDVSAFRSTRLGAIGPATARALEALGLHVEFVPTEFLGETIGLEMPVEPRQRVLLLRGDIASDLLARRLTERGVEITDVDAYRTVKASEVFADLDGVDAVTFTSSSTVRNFVAMHPAKNGLGRAAVFCIGPVTADTASELGLHVDAVATEHTVDGLLRTMIEYYRTKGDAINP